METKIIPLEELIAYENNAKEHPQEQIEQIKNSIREFDYIDLIAVDENNVIIEGHGRLLALKELGYENVEVIVLRHLTEEQKNAYRIVHNQLTMNSDWDMEKLKEELSKITLDMSMLGIEESLIEELEESAKQLEEDDFNVDEALEEIKEPIAKYGDVFQLGNHRLMCGDSTNSKDVEKLMDGKTFNLLFTSPPYNMNKNMYRSYEDNLESREYINFNLKVVNEYKKYLKGFLFWNISYNKNARWEFIEILYKIIKETNLLFLELIVWNKKKAMPIRSEDMLTRTYEDILLMGTEEVENDIEMFACVKNDKKAIFNKRTKNKISNYWEFTSNNTQLDNHKACFPLELPKKAINLTTMQGENVCDCFGGSGSTLIACEQLNRNCFIMEFDPIYVDVIIRRWEEYTGKKAVKL